MKNLACILAICIYGTSAQAAKIVLEKSTPSGESELFMAETVEPAAECSDSIKEIILTIDETMKNGRFGKLLNTYTPTATILHKTTIFDRPPQTSQLSTQQLISALQESRKQASEYKYMHMGGSCQKLNNETQYTGNEIEKITFPGKEPVWATSKVTYKFNETESKIVAATMEVSIQRPD